MTTHIHPRAAAVASRKGGVAKTTTVINTAAVLAELKPSDRTLVVDLDPQAHATRCAGVNAPKGQQGTHRVIAEGHTIAESVVRSKYGFDVLTSGKDVVMTGLHLAANRGDELRLREALAVTDYDHVLIDCPGTIGDLTLTGLLAAQTVLVPVLLEDLALDGLQEVQALIDQLVARGYHPNLRLGAVVEARVDMRSDNARVVHAELVEYAGGLLLRATLRASSFFPAAQKARMPLTHYMPKSDGAADCRRMVAELVERGLL